MYSPAGVLWPTQHVTAAVQPRCVSAAAADSSLHRRALGLRCIHVPRVRSSHGRRDRKGVRLRYKGSSRGCQCCIQSVSSVEESHRQGEMWGMFLMCITSALDPILNWNVMLLSIFTKYHIFTYFQKRSDLCYLHSNQRYLDKILVLHWFFWLYIKLYNPFNFV